MIKQDVLLASLLLVTQSSVGQQDHVKTGERDRNADDLKAFTEEQATSQEGERTLKMYGVDAFPCEKEAANEQVRKTCMQARQAYYDYYAKGLPRRTRVYEWNNLSTKVIFFVVLSLVFVGVLFSWKQFFGMTVKRSLGRSEAPEEDKKEQSAVTTVKTAAELSQALESEQTAVTELEVGPGGIKVKSPVLGVILLTISLAFFYLYLRYVYPVTANF